MAPVELLFTGELLSLIKRCPDLQLEINFPWGLPEMYINFFEGDPRVSNVVKLSFIYIAQNETIAAAGGREVTEDMTRAVMVTSQVRY